MTMSNMGISLPPGLIRDQSTLGNTWHFSTLQLQSGWVDKRPGSYDKASPSLPPVITLSQCYKQYGYK